MCMHNKYINIMSIVTFTEVTYVEYIIFTMFHLLHTPSRMCSGLCIHTVYSYTPVCDITSLFSLYLLTS